MEWWIHLSSSWYAVLFTSVNCVAMRDCSHVISSPSFNLEITYASVGDGGHFCVQPVDFCVQPVHFCFCCDLLEHIFLSIASSYSIGRVKLWHLFEAFEAKFLCDIFVWMQLHTPCNAACFELGGILTSMILLLAGPAETSKQQKSRECLGDLCHIFWSTWHNYRVSPEEDLSSFRHSIFLRDSVSRLFLTIQFKKW